MASEVFISIIIVVVVVVIILTSLAWVTSIWFCRRRAEGKRRDVSNNSSLSNYPSESLLSELPSNYMLKRNGKVVTVGEGTAVDENIGGQGETDRLTFYANSSKSFCNRPILGLRQGIIDDEDDSGVSLVYPQAREDEEEASFEYYVDLPNDCNRRTSQDESSPSKRKNSFNYHSIPSSYKPNFAQQQHQQEPKSKDFTKYTKENNSHSQKYQHNKIQRKCSCELKSDTLLSHCDTKPICRTGVSCQNNTTGAKDDHGGCCSPDPEVLQSSAPDGSCFDQNFPTMCHQPESTIMCQPTHTTNQTHCGDTAPSECHRSGGGVVFTKGVNHSLHHNLSHVLHDTEEYQSYGTSSSGIESGLSSENVSLNSEAETLFDANVILAPVGV